MVSSIFGDRANSWCARFHRGCDSRSRRRKDSVRGLPDSVPYLPGNAPCARSDTVSRSSTGASVEDQGGQGRLPGWSNCKGPTRAAVCSHSARDRPTHIPLKLVDGIRRYHRLKLVALRISLCSRRLRKDGTGSPSRVASSVVNSCCVHCMDCYPRRDIPRDPAILSARMHSSAKPYATQVLLLVHLRILLQPLCGRCDIAHYTLQTTFSRLAWLFCRILFADLDGKSIHEYLQSPAARHQARASGN